jgi:hypothetical protein
MARPLRAIWRGPHESLTEKRSVFQALSNCLNVTPFFIMAGLVQAMTSFLLLPPRRCLWKSLGSSSQTAVNLCALWVHVLRKPRTPDGNRLNPTRPALDLHHAAATERPNRAWGRSSGTRLFIPSGAARQGISSHGRTATARTLRMSTTAPSRMFFSPRRRLFLCF